MRIRLLLDTMMDEAETVRLAEAIAEQPSALIEVTGIPGIIGARLVGAQPVHNEAGV